MPNCRLWENYQTMLYNLDAIISVGYRVNFIKATRFCQWATLVLKEYQWERNKGIEPASQAWEARALPIC